MKKTILVALSVVSSLVINAQSYSYNYFVNLTEVKDDEVTVNLDVTNLGKEELTFHLPKMVPGTYSIYDFGRFVHDFKAFDASGKELAVAYPDSNTWVIKNAKTCKKITYDIEDSFDTQLDNVIFEPAGTSIEENTVFAVNTHGFFGYFDGFINSPYKVTFQKPENMFGSSALKTTKISNNSQTFEAADYHFLADGPILFCEPDTTTIVVGSAKVLVSVYSPNHLVSSQDLAKEIKPTLEAQKEYLGGSLPVDHYAFLIYLSPSGYLSGSAGALEHSYSSFYCLMEAEPSAIAQTVRDVAAHEFFHVVTPLSIHSEEIGNFDFINPKMSQHLWMYEGQTEYAAHLAQVRMKNTTVEHFLGVMSGKIYNQKKVFNDDLSFTEMSKGCLDVYKDQYGNVYEKGALITMCLDLKLRKLSGGSMGVRDLMKNLSKEYGIQKSFKDDELFDKIVQLTYPEVRDFINRYIVGYEALPYKEYLSWAGIEFLDKGKVFELSPFGGLDKEEAIDFDVTLYKLKVKDENALNEFGKNGIGFKTGDTIMEWNGEDLTLMNVNEVLGKYAATVKEGDDLSITVMRNGKSTELKTKIKKVEVEKEFVLQSAKKVKKKQKKFRISWLNS